MILRNISRVYQRAIESCRCSQRSIYGFSKQQSDYGIKFDEEKIKKKMQEIRQRKEGNTAKKEQKLEFMNVNTSNEIMRKVRKYRESTNTQNLLHFADPSLEQKPTTLQVTGYDEHTIEVDNMTYPPCMIVFKNQVLVWQVQDVENLTNDDFIILKYVSPKPTYVIVGVNEPSKFPTSVKGYISQMYQNFDVLQLFEATSQFNVTSNDDINVVAFLISK